MFDCYIIDRNVDARELAKEIKQPDLVPLIRQFLYQQLHPDSPDYSDSSMSAPPALPFFDEPLSIYPSAVAVFHAPSDICGIGGMRRERIRAVPSWRRGAGRYDCVFVNSDSDEPGMLGLEVARARRFFSFTFRGKLYPCALVHWYSRLGDGPDEDSGMWIVRRDLGEDGAPKACILHLDTIVRAAHLIAMYGDVWVPKGASHTQSLDLFESYYINKYIDHHAFETAF